jgi:hypothetical protein
MRRPNNPTSDSWTRRHRGILLIIVAVGGMLACDYAVSKVAGDAIGKIADETVIEYGGEGSARRIIGSPFALKEEMTSVNGVPPYVYRQTVVFPENIGRNAAYFKDMIFAGLVAAEGWVLGLYELFRNRRNKKAQPETARP